MTLDTPQIRPWLNQLVTTWLAVPPASSRSVSEDAMERETVSFCLRARISAQIMA